MVTNTERLVEEFFKKRFPEKDIAFEKKSGYFGIWVERFESENPEEFMDNWSLRVWKEMRDGSLESLFVDIMMKKIMKKRNGK